MSAHMRKRPTNAQLKLQDQRGNMYVIPRSVALKYKVSSDDASLTADEFFESIDKQYTKAGVLLRGLRLREGMTQELFAKKIHVTQANLSKMELGYRPIGRVIAQRIEKVFGVNYRLFLE